MIAILRAVFYIGAIARLAPYLWRAAIGILLAVTVLIAIGLVIAYPALLLLPVGWLLWRYRRAHT